MTFGQIYRQSRALAAEKGSLVSEKGGVSGFFSKKAETGKDVLSIQEQEDSRPASRSARGRREARREREFWAGTSAPSSSRRRHADREKGQELPRAAVLPSKKNRRNRIKHDCFRQEANVAGSRENGHISRKSTKNPRFLSKTEDFLLVAGAGFEPTTSGL